jgi:hypothetical protein
MEWSNFPEEMKLYIFDFMGSKDLLACTHISKEWRVLANREDIWRALFRRVWKWDLPRDLPISAKESFYQYKKTRNVIWFEYSKDDYQKDLQFLLLLWLPMLTLLLFKISIPLLFIGLGLFLLQIYDFAGDSSRLSTKEGLTLTFYAAFSFLIYTFITSWQILLFSEWPLVVPSLCYSYYSLLVFNYSVNPPRSWYMRQLRNNIAIGFGPAIFYYLVSTSLHFVGVL